MLLQPPPQGSTGILEKTDILVPVHDYHTPHHSHRLEKQDPARYYNSSKKQGKITPSPSSNHHWVKASQMNVTSTTAEEAPLPRTVQYNTPALEHKQEQLNTLQGKRVKTIMAASSYLLWHCNNHKHAAVTFLLFSMGLFLNKRSKKGLARSLPREDGYVTRDKRGSSNIFSVKCNFNHGCVKRLTVFSVSWHMREVCRPGIEHKQDIS